MAHEMRDLRAPNLVLAGHAIDVRTRTADVPALHDGGPPPTRAICHASNFPPAPTSPAAHWRRGETMDDRRDYGRIGKRSPTNISDTSQRRSALSGSSAYDLTPSSASRAALTAAARQSSR